MSAYDNRQAFSGNAGDQQYQSNLIINYLPQTLADDEFRRIFEGMGPVTSAKIVRNKATGYSFGYGFVEYQNAEDAVKAIDELNGMQLENKRIKVAYSRPQSDETKGAKIMVKNLEDANLETLNEIFSKFGTIVQSYIAPSGNAFVLFEKREYAQQALHELDNTVLPGASQPLEIKFAFVKNRQYNGNQYNDQSRQYNAYAGNNQDFANSYGTDRSAGRQSRYQDASSGYDAYNRGAQSADAYGGPIRSNSQYGQRSHYSNRYNPMGSPYGQQADLNSNGGGSYSQYRSNAYGNYQQGGQSNSANYAGQGRSYQNYQQSGNRNDNQSGHTMFVYNVAQSTDEDLHSLFSMYGTVSSASKTPNKPFGFVTMENYEHATNAIQELNDSVVNGQKIQVSFKAARRG